MSLFTKLGNDIASPVDAAGNKRSVDNGDMQVWMTEVERLSAAKAMGAVTFGTLAEANGSLAYDAWSTAWVINDPVPANNGWYTKTGASGSGFWVRLGDLPYCYIRATNAGAGSANAIVATTTMPIPMADGGALISLNITSSNTATPVTVSFNGAPPLTIKTNAGNNPVIGGLVAGTVLAGYKAGTEFRLLSDQASAAIVAAAEDAAIRAENAALSVVSRAWFKTVPDLVADNNEVIGYAGSGADFEVVAGDMVDAQGFRAEVAASDEADPDLTTAALVNLFVKPTQHGFVNPEQLGLIGAGGNDHPKIQRALDSGYPVVLPKGTFRVSEPIEQTRAGQIIRGCSLGDCVIRPHADVEHDLFRLRGLGAEVSGIYFSGYGSINVTRDELTACVRILGGYSKVIDNLFMSRRNGRGAAIIVDNQDPDTEAFLGVNTYGQYISRNRIGNWVNGYFHAGVRCFANATGTHAMTIDQNRIITSRAIVFGGGPSGEFGGLNSGDRVVNNTLASALAEFEHEGYGIDCSEYTYLLTVSGNYIERYQYGVFFRGVSDSPPITRAWISDNTYDNNGTDVYSWGTQLYHHENTRTRSLKFYDAMEITSGGVLAPRMVGSLVKQTVNLTANNQVVTPTSSQIAINGGGANRTGITIANGIHEGQELTITASTWGATIVNTGGAGGIQNVYFNNNASTAVMGIASGNFAMLKLKWVTNFLNISGTTYGCWVEQSRLTRP